MKETSQRDLSRAFPTQHAIDVANYVQSLADALAANMKAIHGGDFRVWIDHDRQMILVRVN